MTTMAQTACPRCNGTIAAGAQFCGSCGAQLGAAPPPPPIPQPPPAPQPPPLPQMARDFTGASGGNAKQATFNGTAQDAYNQALNALNVSANGITNISEFGTVGVARLEAAPGVYQAKLLFAGRIAASAPVMASAA